jgi:hypothetical protein
LGHFSQQVKEGRYAGVIGRNMVVTDEQKQKYARFAANLTATWTNDGFDSCLTSHRR